MSSLTTPRDVLTLGKGCKEATHERIARTIGVHDLRNIDLLNWVLRDLPPDSDHSWVLALRDHNRPTARLTSLLYHRDKRQTSRDEFHILCFPRDGFRVRKRLCLVTEQVVG